VGSVITAETAVVEAAAADVWLALAAGGALDAATVGLAAPHPLIAHTTTVSAARTRPLIGKTLPRTIAFSGRNKTMS
jgi:hypothetical protein